MNDSDTPGALAVSYLRVSTKEQAERGGREEGFSIPAQREANQRKAESLDATVVEWFTDAGESARSASRPELQRMLAYVAEHPVKYCIVHKLDRLARNRADDVAIHFALTQAGVTLVSTTENIDETPSGMLMHGIMSSIAEFYSRNLANEVTKGLVQKASLGGTVSRAPLGYRNVVHTDDLGRTLRTVEVDTDRSHLITWAFLTYADGEHSVADLVAELNDRGLTTRPTPKWPAKPVSVPSLHKMLRNPYYKGEVVYRGLRYPGIHPPLIDPGTWHRVQDRLTANNQAGTNQRTHRHYLKGSVYCGSCGSRLLLLDTTNRHGSRYAYFICSGRHTKRTECTRQAMLVDTIADLIEREYRTIALSPDLRDHVDQLVNEDFDALHAAAETERRDLTTQRTKLTAQRQKLLDAHYAGAIPLDLLKTEQDRIASQLLTVEQRLDAANTTYEAARARLADCLDLARDCHAAYLQADDNTRRLFNQAFFRKIYIDEDDTIRFDYNPPYDQLLARLIPAAQHQARSHHHSFGNDREKTQSARRSTPTGASLDPAGIDEVQGFHPSNLVELRGFEPLTPSMRNLGIAVYAGRLGHSVAILGRYGSVRVDVVAGRTAGTAITGSGVLRPDRMQLFMPSVLPRRGGNRIPPIPLSRPASPSEVPRAQAP